MFRTSAVTSIGRRWGGRGGGLRFALARLAVMECVLFAAKPLRALDPAVPVWRNVQDVWVMNLDGSGQDNLTETAAPLDEFGPTFSPTGSRIAFTREDATFQDDIWTMNVNGSDPTNLTNTASPLSEGIPDWQSIQRCGGRKVTLVGDAGPDTIKGTKRADVISGLAGKDKILGRGGNDRICGGAGKDRLVGGRGRDRLAGGGGKDRCIGGTGRDQRSSCERGAA